MKMLTSANTLRALLATTAVAAALSFAAPSFAQNATTNAPAAAPAAQPKKMMKHHLDPASVEANVEKMHAALKITNEQETQFDAVAQVMRDNATSLRQLIMARRDNKTAMTAVDDLKSFAQIKQAEADGVNKLVPAFDALYNVLSDDQKKIADSMFAHQRHRKS